MTLPDAPARLAYLQREAWNVADRVGGELKVDAVNVALHIDQLLGRVGRRKAREGCVTVAMEPGPHAELLDAGDPRRRRGVPGHVRGPRRRGRRAPARGRRALPLLVGGRAAAQLRPPGRPPQVGRAGGRRARGGRAGCAASWAARATRPPPATRSRSPAWWRATTPGRPRPRRRCAEGGDAFARAAEALAALAARGAAPRYDAAVAAIVADFEGRDAHLTGVADRRHRDADGGPRRAPRHGRPPPLGPDPGGSPRGSGRVSRERGRPLAPAR